MPDIPGLSRLYPLSPIPPLPPLPPLLLDSLLFYFPTHCTLTHPFRVYIISLSSLVSNREHQDEAMKNSIPSDVWERKKALIAKLYKDEEWPLKQVIKQIRSADFNPR